MDEKMKTKIESICNKQLDLIEKRIDGAMQRSGAQFGWNDVTENIQGVEQILKIKDKVAASEYNRPRVAMKEDWTLMKYRDRIEMYENERETKKKAFLTGFGIAAFGIVAGIVIALLF